MSDISYESFIDYCNKSLREKDSFNVAEALDEYYHEVIQSSPSFYRKYDLAKERASFIKFKTINDLPSNIIDFDSKFTSLGGKIIYAQDKNEALHQIIKIVEKYGEKRIFFTQDKLTKELELGEFLKKENKNYFDTSLNSFYVKMSAKKATSEEKIFNFTFDSLEKEVRKFFNIDEYEHINPFDIIRKYYMSIMYKGSISISGVDFLISETGSIAISDSIGADLFKNIFSDVQIYIAGIDSFLSNLQDLESFVSLFSTHSSSDFLPWSFSLLSNFKEDSLFLDTLNQNKVKETYVIIVDNGRSTLLREPNQREILSCIHCDACKALCPVFKFLRNKETETLYSGPISCVNEPFINGFWKTAHIPFICTLCAKCDEVCPMNISLTNHILNNRKKACNMGNFVSLDKSKMKILKKMFLKRNLLESPYYRFILKTKLKLEFGNQKNFPDFSQKSFHILWQENQKK